MQPLVQTARERRQGQPAIPDDVDRLLTSRQRQALDQVTSFGWRLAFVRHPLLEDPTIVVTPDGGASYAIIASDGELEFSSELRVRH